MRIFFDTNFIISAFITHGHASELFSYCLANHRNYTSDFVIVELEKNLPKFDYSEEEIKIVTNFLNINFSIISGAAASKSKVNCIITGDKDLLVLKKYNDISILSPRDFWSFEKSFK